MVRPAPEHRRSEDELETPPVHGRDIVFFFFQAEDGIRDTSVTRVQTCALPICELRRFMAKAKKLFTIGYEQTPPKAVLDELEQSGVKLVVDVRAVTSSRRPGFSKRQLAAGLRSEERRVGKGGRARRSAEHQRSK